MTASVSALGQITVVGDSAVALLLGLTAGILCYFSNFSETYLAWMAFSKEFFFYGAEWPDSNGIALLSTVRVCQVHHIPTESELACASGGAGGDITPCPGLPATASASEACGKTS